MNTVFIYGLNDPRTGECRYVGKTTSPKSRLASHVSDVNRGKTHKNNWISGLLAAGLRPVLEVIDEVPEPEWEFWEREYLRVYRAIGVRLTNLTDGGESPTGLTEESKEKMREAGRNRTFSEATRAKMSATHKLMGPPCLGRKHTEEEKKKIGDFHRGRKRSIETREKISRALKGRERSAEHGRNISRAKLGKSRRSAPLTAEHLRNISLAKRGKIKEL